MTKEERTKIYAIVDAVKWKIVVTDSKQFKFDDEVRYSTQKEQIKRTRDSKVVSYIRSVYDLCSVVGCDYSEYDVAHIHALKHGADDLPENCLALCPNHHRDLDRGRMLPLRQLDVGGYIYFGEQGIKLKHKVDSKYLDQCNLELEEWKNAS
jgi:predicted restriction endonuclease